MIRFALVILSLFFIHISLWAQPKNNYCRSAITLRDVSNWCSSPGQYSTKGATPSGFERANCFFGAFDLMNDVWFKFTATGNTLNVSVKGNMARIKTGTLEYPQLAIYRGSCKEFLDEVACYADSQGDNIAETFASLTIGETYYIRVDGKHNNTGTFQLCVNNYNSVPSPSADCSSGVILCDKSSFTVPKMVGVGKQHDPLEGLCLPGESSSVWYKWTCDKPGTLTMTLKPVNPSDDIDFALFWLPNGVEDCRLKIPLRCMASGENGGRPFETWEPCTGETGLKAPATDHIEYEGCQELDDNFLAPLKMESGKSYAMIINNFHNTGNGFSIEFGGTGTFEGPVAHFKVSKLTIPTETPLKLWNASSFIGKIKKHEWNFGLGATPKTARGIGPHTVTYDAPGKKSISLAVETDRGCQVTKVRNVKVLEKPKEPPKEEKKEEVSASPTPPHGPLKGELPYSSSEAIPSRESDLTASTDGPVFGPESAGQPSQPLNKFGKSENPTDTIIRNYKVLHVYKLYYASDSFNLKEGHIPFLKEAIGWLEEDPKALFNVEGHTNNIPQDDYCMKLADKRAQSVINYLATHGVPRQKIKEKILGKSQPQATNKSLWGRKRNQRVEIKILKPGE